MRRRRVRICLQRFLKRFNRALIIHRIDAALAENEMRLLFLVRLVLARGQAAAQRDPEPKGKHAEPEAISK